MARALGILVVASTLGLFWPAVSMAAEPIGLDVSWDFDEMGRTDHVTLQWKPVKGATDYTVLWWPDGEPKTFSTRDTSGKTKLHLPITPGEATRVQVVARDRNGRQITRSPPDLVKLPKGKVIGGGILHTHGVLRMSTGSGTDHQDTRGTVQFQIFSSPTGSAGKYAVYGFGTAQFKEVTTAKSGTFRIRATAPMFVKGFLRHPTDEEKKKGAWCRLDLKITEAFKGRVAHASGSVYGIPVPDSVISDTVVKKALGIPWKNKHVAKLAPDQAHQIYTLKLETLNFMGPGPCKIKSR